MDDFRTKFATALEETARGSTNSQTQSWQWFGGDWLTGAPNGSSKRLAEVDGMMMGCGRIGEVHGNTKREGNVD